MQPSTIQTHGILFYLLYHLSYAGSLEGLEPIPAETGREAGLRPEQVTSSLQEFH